MSWSGGILQAGMGNVAGEMGFVSVLDPDPFIINAASFTSDSNSNWMFNAEEGKTETFFYLLVTFASHCVLVTSDMETSVLLLPVS